MIYDCVRFFYHHFFKYAYPAVEEHFPSSSDEEIDLFVPIDIVDKQPSSKKSFFYSNDEEWEVIKKN
jgi:hypothetical protein